MKLKDVYLKLYNTKNKETFRRLGDYAQFFGLVYVILYSIFAQNFMHLLCFAIFYMICISLSSILKVLFNNKRPVEIEGSEKDPKNEELKFGISAREGNSFPSGHTASAMTSIYLFNFGIIPGLLGLFVGLFTGWTRIINRKHWIRDVGFSIFADVAIFLMFFYI